MENRRNPRLARERAKKLKEAREILAMLGFVGRQSNDGAGRTLLALLDLKPFQGWSDASAPMRGITPIIKFIAKEHGKPYKPNTRETIRDEAVKYFVEAGMVFLNPDDSSRPITSAKTVYQVEPGALDLFRSYGAATWKRKLVLYLASREHIRRERERVRAISKIPVSLPSGERVHLSPGGQNPLIKLVVEEFCGRFSPAGTVLYVGDAEGKFMHYEVDYLKRLGIVISAPSKMPDVLVHDVRRNWLLLIEAVVSAGAVDSKRRVELKKLFSGSKAGLVFVTAFASREAMRSFLPQISWETEVWVADDPEHLIHFNGERFLGPHPDVGTK